MADRKTEKKSIMEEALLEAQEIQKAAQNNAKEILASTMKPEIDSIVKEAIEKEENSIDENTKVEESHEQPKVAEENTEKVKKENDDNLNDDLDDELEVEEPSELESEIDISDEAGVDQIDLSKSPDDEVVKVFKKMNSEDQIEITKDGDSINFKDEDKEYRIELSESEKGKKGKLNEEGICEDCPDHNNSIDMENNSDDEIIYEIELDEDEKNVQETEENAQEEDLEETFNVTHTEGKNVTSKPQNFNVRSRMGDSRYKSSYQESVEKNKQLITKFNSLRSKAEKILSENKELKAIEGKYKSAFIDLRGKLNQIGLFNSNLAHVTRIMTEQTTTKSEKSNIVKRFDKVKSINESKALYKTILGELKKEPIKETVEKKIIKPSNSGASQINEDKTFVDPQIGRMMDLIKYSTNGK